MKILIVLAGFLPGKKYGGPPISVDNFCSLMKDDECYIVTTNHDMGESMPYEDVKEGWIDRGNCKVLYLSDAEYGYINYKKVIEEIRPDLIYLQSLFQNCVIPCLFLAKKYKIPVLLAPRGELCKGAFKKKYKKMPYIWFLMLFSLIDKVNFQSTSDEETEAIKRYLSVNSERIHFLTNVPSIPKKDYPTPYKEPGMAKFVFVSRIVRKKNLKTAISYFRDIKANVTFDIFGPIEDRTYWEECQEQIKALPCNVKVNYCGLLSHDHIHETFAKYHAFLFPTLSENFGHVIAEALSAGCLVLASNKTPWNDLYEYNAGWALDLDARDEFVKELNNIINYDNAKYLTKRQLVKRYFSIKNNIDVLKNKYISVLEKIHI